MGYSASGAEVICLALDNTHFYLGSNGALCVPLPQSANVLDHLDIAVDSVSLGTSL